MQPRRTILLLATLALTLITARAQERLLPPPEATHYPPLVAPIRLPADLKIEQWRADYEDMAVPEKYRMAVPMSSVVKVTVPKLPKNYIILENQTLRTWRLLFSNGSAYNWGVPPGSLLDARTLSMPAPR